MVEVARPWAPAGPSFDLNRTASACVSVECLLREVFVLSDSVISEFDARDGWRWLGAGARTRSQEMCPAGAVGE